MRISFTGDIMCELPSLKKAKHDGRYIFTDTFCKTKSTFSKTDYLVGNLETVFAGQESYYSTDIYSYNTPDSFAGIMKQIGFDFVSTANNHCLDRGIRGLKRTLDILDQNGIKHTGTFRDQNERNMYSVIDISGIKIGFLAYTYGSNYAINRVEVKKEDITAVNFFTPQDWNAVQRNGFFNSIKEKYLKRSTRVALLKLFGKVYNSPRIDDDELGELNRYVYSDIQNIKKKCDYLVVLMHSGGQFNKLPGKYTIQLTQKLLNAGTDIIIGNHPHVVQRIWKDNNKFISYSLGNFYISPDTVYLLDEFLPLYSIVLHIDIQQRHDIKASF